MGHCFRADHFLPPQCDERGDAGLARAPGGHSQPIANYFVTKYSKHFRMKAKTVSPEALASPVKLRMAGERARIGEHH